jgi:ELWxxDGT repeat protein
MSDGTAAGTRLVVDLDPGPDGSYPVPSIVADGRLYFVGNDGTHGYETWSTTGTAASTTLLADVDPGPGNGVDADGGEPQDQVGGWLAFVGNDGRTGFEPWVVGTGGGPRQIGDLQPGAVGSDPAFLGTVHDNVVLAGDVDGEPSLLAWSPPAVPATPAASVVRARPKHRYSTHRAVRRRIVVPVTVASVGLVPDGGEVTLVRRGRILGSAPLVGGHANVRINRRLRPHHRYVLRATWSGNATAAPATSAPFRIRVSGG